jgi:small conductance mechanosensitive channel
MGDLDKIAEQVQQLVALYGLRILAAAGIMIAGRIAAGLLRSFARRMAEKTRADTTITTFVGNIVYATILVFSLLAALGQLGVETTAFIAVLGAAGLAVGLAFQGSLANFSAGFLMVVFRPFRVDDFVEGGGVTGVVRDIGIFTTTIMTPDNRRVIVPNAKLTGDIIINYTAEKQRRVDLTVGVSYDADIDKVRDVLMDEVMSVEGVLKDPAPQIAVRELGDSSVNFVVRPWTEPAKYWDVYFAVTEAVKKRLDREGISIPYPQRDVHIKKEG